MNREQARDFITANGAKLLTPDRSGKGFICPLCGSGSGKKGTGITTKDGVHYTCWAGCFTNSDIIDIVGLEKGLTDYNSKLKAAADEFNITIEYGGSGFNAAEGNKQPAPAPPKVDYTDFFLEANKHIEETDYHRGLTLDTLNRFKVGFIRNWKNPKAPDGVAPSPRLIIPTSAESYLARDTRADIPANQKRYAKNKVGTLNIFNADVLYTADKPIYIVEGEIDAMSIIDVGGEAVGLGTVTMVKTFLKMVEAKKPIQPLLVALDNDGAGDNAAKTLERGLEELCIPFYEYNPAIRYKDANEALNADREQLKKAVNAIYNAPMNEKIEIAILTAEAAENKQKEAERIKAEDERRELQKEAVLFSIPSFIQDIEESKKKTYISTGFDGLDKLLDGGLYAGLYIVGAISSLGKTTFCLQIADQIAQKGTDVLIFSLEMARNELMAKSVSRLSYISDVEKYNSSIHAKTTRGILTGAKYADYTPTERTHISDAIAEYSRYTEHIYITEGVGDIGIAQIKERIEKQIRVTGKPPVVLIDYLQIIAPADVRATDKQNTDKAVLELKRMSRDYKIPVIGISSFNRDNYNAPVNLTSFKESGAIEYSSDVLIGLQREGMDYIDGEKELDRLKRISRERHAADEAARLGRAQKIQVKILKNRNGAKGDINMEFYPMFNYFKENTENSRAIIL